MNIGIIGYGKMGKLIEKIALERGHQVLLRISGSNLDHFTEDRLKELDVAIEFSLPETGYDNVTKCINAGISTISGTTGWTDKLPEINQLALQKEVGFIYASNFSLGVNLFFSLNDKLAKMMKTQTAYQTSLEEIHHTSKKDSPSGTAITLANQIIAQSEYTHWTNQPANQSNELPIISKRKDPAPGTHTITYASSIDSIQINHTAHSREGFALGAVVAAEWIHDKKGVYTMNDVLGLG